MCNDVQISFNNDRYKVKVDNASQGPLHGRCIEISVATHLGVQLLVGLTSKSLTLLHNRECPWIPEFNETSLGSIVDAAPQDQDLLGVNQLAELACLQGKAVVDGRTLQAPIYCEHESLHNAGRSLNSQVTFLSLQRHLALHPHWSSTPCCKFGPMVDTSSFDICKL